MVGLQSSLQDLTLGRPARGGPGLVPGRPVGPTPPFSATVYCRPAPSVTRYRPGIDDAVQIGPLVFWGLAVPRTSSRFTAGAPPVTVAVTVPPETRAVVAVPEDRRDVAGLDTGARPARRPVDAERTVVCVTGPAQRTFRISFVVDGPQCLPVSVTTGGRTDTVPVRFGVRRCA